MVTPPSYNTSTIPYQSSECYGPIHSLIILLPLPANLMKATATPQSYTTSTIAYQSNERYRPPRSLTTLLTLPTNLVNVTSHPILLQNFYHYHGPSLWPSQLSTRKLNYESDTSRNSNLVIPRRRSGCASNLTAFIIQEHVERS